MEKIARFVVKYRYIFAVLILVAMIASFFTINLVNIEESIAVYLPDETNTKRALKIMDKEFTTYGSATIMLKGVTLDRAKSISADLAKIEGVKGVEFAGNDEDFKGDKALVAVTFKGGATDEVSTVAYDKVVGYLKDNAIDMVIPTPLYTDFAARLKHDVTIVLGLCAVIILIILLITSKSYAEVIVFPVVFVVAALLNMGTNFWFGTISFVSNTVCVILQLALAIDYSIILCHRFTAEKAVLGKENAKEAMVMALSKAIPEILSSCLTTVSGLVALVTMQLKLGQDLGLVLAKSILFSILVVIVLMPTLLLWVSKWMDKTVHKSFVPEFKGWTKGILKSRKVLPVIFLVFVVVFGIVSVKIDYSYAVNCIDTNKPTDVQVAIAERDEVFGYDNLLVVLVPKEDYKNEKAIIDKALTHSEVKEVTGISNIEIGGTYLVDKLNSDELISRLNLDNKTGMLVRLVYNKYYVDNGIDKTIDEGRVRLLDLALYLSRYVKEQNIDLPAEIQSVMGLLEDADSQLIGDNYTRILLSIDFPQEGEEVFAFTTGLEKELKDIDEGIIFAGESMSAYDLSKSFETDTFIISILTGVFVYIILLFTFKSWGLPVALVAVIQGAILINFGLVPIFGKNFFFFVYLIVSAIQMGATIDYAIIVTNHYREERRVKPKDIAIYDAMSASFPAIITSGTIMVIAPLFVGIFISDPLVSSLGYCLSRGSFISILSVLTVLPQLLYTFEKAFLKTTFRYGKNDKKLTFAPDWTTIDNSVDTSATKVFYDDAVEENSVHQDNANISKDTSISSTCDNGAVTLEDEKSASDTLDDGVLMDGNVTTNNVDKSSDETILVDDNDDASKGDDK